VQGCCEHGNEPSGSIKCWTERLAAFQEGLSSMELVRFFIMFQNFCLCFSSVNSFNSCSGAENTQTVFLCKFYTNPVLIIYFR
jgi:hypothetical protein